MVYTAAPAKPLPAAMTELSLYLADENATLALGARLAQGLRAGATVWLHGALGAGKTTLTRGFLRALGVSGAVKSPTYTLVESYTLSGPVPAVHHFDLYRIADAGELDFLGLDEFIHRDSVCLIEWAERGAAALPAPTLEIELSRQGDGRLAVLTVGSGQDAGELFDFLSKSIS